MNRLIISLILLLCTALNWAEGKISIAFVRQPTWLTKVVDPTLKKKLNDLGYQIGGLSYSEVSFERLKEFNVAILQWAPSEGDLEAVKIYKSKIPDILRFVEQGGGVLITCEGSYKVVNELLSPLGAEILPETVVDEKNLYRQKAYLGWYFCSTHNIKKHPITLGIKEIWYPLGYGPYKGGHTLTMKVNEDWEVIVRGNEGAHSSNGTYKDSPPLIAVRNYGKGRIVLFPTHCSYWTHDAYHRVWERICLERGDGLQLLLNIFAWLASPSLEAHIFGGFTEPPEKPSPLLPPQTGVASTDIYSQLIAGGARPFIKKIEHKKESYKDFVGVIGVYTTYSKGFHNVHEYCELARRMGYNFIVFTEDFELMDEEKWGKLVQDCRNETGGDFIAIPGIEYNNGQRIAFALPRWPNNKEWLDKEGRKIIDHPGFYFGLDWPPVYLMAPKLNFSEPWYEKFYSGLEVFSYYRGSRLISDALDWYLQCQANDYNLIPIVGHRVYSLGELEETKDTYKTHILAKQIKEVPSAFKYFWYAPRYVYVSNGPRILEYAIENGRCGYREEEWRIYLEVESDVPLKEVLILDRKEIFRRFKPKGKHFKAEIIGYHDKQRFFTMIVKDVEGRSAISPTLYTSDMLFSNYMCTDLQNTIGSMWGIDENGKPACVSCPLGLHVTGWEGWKPGVLVPEKEIMPEGLDYVVRGFTVNACPVFYTKEGAEGGVAQIDLVFNSGDCNIMDKHYSTTLLPGSHPAPTRIADSKTRLILFRPRLYSYNMLLIEQETKIKKDIRLVNKGDHRMWWGPWEGPQIVAMGVSAPETFENYSYIGKDGRKHLGKRATKEKVTIKCEKLPKGAYVALYPDFYGSVAVFAYDKDYDFSLADEGIQIGYDRPGAFIPKGTVLRQKFLLVRGRFGEADDSGFDLIRKLYGFEGKPGYKAKILHGKLNDQVFALDISAKNYFASVRIGKAQLPNDLPIIVQGLNENWDAGMLDEERGELRRVGVFENSAYLTLDISGKTRQITVGNLVICDNPQIKLNLLKLGSDYWIEAHNPMDKKVTVSIGIPSWLEKVLPKFNTTITLSSGESKRIKVCQNVKRK